MSDDEKDRQSSDKSSADVNSSSEEDRASPETKTCYDENKLMVIRSVNYGFKVAVDYRKYRLADTSLKYDRTVTKNVTKMAKRMTNQMKAHTFDPLDPISVLEFLKHFIMA